MLTPQQLPGGYTLGETVYFVGTNQVFDRANRIVHGEQGQLVGRPADQEDRLALKMPANENFITLQTHEVSRSPPPPLPGGYKIGDELYYIGANEANGTRLVHGQLGEVLGPRTGGEEPMLSMMFPGKEDKYGGIGCPLYALSRSRPPPLPGGYKIGDKRYYVGPNETFPC